MVRSSGLTAALAALVVVFLPMSEAAAQRRAELGRFEIQGLDFSADGAWRARTRQIRQVRRDLLRAGALRALNAPGQAGPKVTGTFNVPVILISFLNSPVPFTPAEYQDVLFNANPTLRPYSIKTYYEQISNGNIMMNGSVITAPVADSSNVYYEDGCNGIGIVTCAHPLNSGVSARFRDLIVEVLTKTNNLGTVNWGQFDNDGPDGVPNSGDDDGRVDFVTFVQPDVDGACGSVHIWAHRWTLGGLAGQMFQTSTPRAGGGFIMINDYTIQSGQGGNGACTAGQIMPIGTVAHETGHAFGLPDLYDTSGDGEGIGEFGLMGSGNYSRAYSPAGFEAWSLAELGWVTVDTLTTTGTVTLNPVQTSDTVLYIPIPNTDEYLLLENRDSLQSDTAQMSAAFGSRKKSPGLLIWHIDQGKITSGTGGNTVNVGTPQGVRLEQADGLAHLQASSGGNRGDAGDTYPGSTVNRKYSYTTNPSSRDNQGVFSGFSIDSIHRNNSGVPGVPSPVVFRFTKRARSLFSSTRVGATIMVNGLTVTSFDDVVAPGDQVMLNVASPQTIMSGRTQLTFASWSNGQASSHTVISDLNKPDTVLASFTANHRVNLTTAPSGGTVSSDLNGNPNLVTGVFVQENLPVTLTATPGQGSTFVRFQGDTTTTNSTLVLPMGRPYALTAVFSSQVAVATQDAVNALLGVPCAQNPCLDQQQLTFLDQSGNNDGVYNLGDFLAHADRSGLNNSAIMQQVLSRPTVSIPVNGAATPTTTKER